MASDLAVPDTVFDNQQQLLKNPVSYTHLTLPTKA